MKRIGGLIEIKLKKKAFEQDLESTKQEIKKLEQQFKLVEKKKAMIMNVERQSETREENEPMTFERQVEEMQNHPSRRRSLCESEVRIIDVKRGPVVGSPVHESHENPPSYNQATAISLPDKTKPDILRIKTNIIHGDNRPVYITSKESSQHALKPAWSSDYNSSTPGEMPLLMKGRQNSFSHDERRYSESECNSNLAAAQDVEGDPPLAAANNAAGRVVDGVSFNPLYDILLRNLLYH